MSNIRLTLNLKKRKGKQKENNQELSEEQKNLICMWSDNLIFKTKKSDIWRKKVGNYQ